MAPISTLPETGKPGIFSLLPEKEKAVRPKQFTWVLLLKAYRAILPFKFGAPFVIRVLLIVSLLALFMECQTITHFKTVRLSLFQPSKIQGLLQCTYGALLALRAKFIGPVVVWVSKLCILLFLVQSMDRLLLCVGFFWIKFNKLKPTVKERVSLARDIESEGLNSDGFPMVLVQIPMRNEREVYAQSIASVCNLDWPREKLLIQVLDDSDDEYIRVLIESEVLSWTEKGVNIIYVHRVIRTGYKAGNLKSAMACDYVKNYEFVAIFDADFQPRPDFLKQTIPHFKDNPKLGLVQARWSFVNESENLLTRLQYVNMCYHFEVEQQVNGIFLDFFGFNGTGGVWRINALKDSGGWLERTTVEDMDIAVRAHLNGWKFIFLNDVFVQCELPESYQAYKMQQHRWNSGPVQLFRQCLPAILTAKLSMWRKAYLIFLFFLLRKLILPFYSFTLFCIILPLTMFIPEAELPTWAIYFIPILMSLLTIIPAPKSFPFLVPYLLFENTISVTKFNAMLSGLFQLGSAYEWVVTKKTGRSSERDCIVDSNSTDAKCLNAEKIHGRLPHESNLEMLVKIEGGKVVAPVSSRERFRLHGKELGLAFVLLAASAKSMLSAQGVHFYFLLFQGLSFLLVGLDLVGEPIG